MLLKTCVRTTVRIFSSLSGPMVEKRSSRLRDTATTSVAARTVAVRGVSYMTASSPKKAPFLSWDMTISCPSISLMASQTPCSMMKSMSPNSPCFMMFLPLWKFQAFSFPTSSYCSALESTSWDSSGILEMCCRSSWSTAQTMFVGTCRSVTSVSATSVCIALARLFVRHSTPKYSPGASRSGQLTSRPRSCCREDASSLCSTSLPFSRT
mmetsp:Transcript_99566/g.321007  ORF Transcript_99566/g.321007 Transcript_99566/m.321007 type:complete len:210 (-) Transcript_99566:1121-1750(-)